MKRVVLRLVESVIQAYFAESGIAKSAPSAYVSIRQHTCLALFAVEGVGYRKQRSRAVTCVDKIGLVDQVRLD